ncbi:MAG: hypothetical protein JWQ97_4070 [Phenylobacterium sp.]|nr:hypothetical protein [Phenylobacterium sp.]
MPKFLARWFAAPCIALTFGSAQAGVIAPPGIPAPTPISSAMMAVPTRQPSGAYFLPRNSAIHIPSQMLVGQVMAVPPTVTAASTDQFNASVTGSIAGTVLTVSAVASGVLQPSETLTGTGIATGTVITSQASGTTGGTGTYNLSVSNTVSSETITASSVQVSNSSNSGGRNLPAFVNDRFTYTRGGSVSASISPAGVNATAVGCQSTTVTYPSVTYTCLTLGESFYHDGRYLEVFNNNTTGEFIKVNDQYITLTPYTSKYVLIDFGSVARRRIDVIANNPSFQAVYVGANDSIDPAPVRGPRVLMVGDSFAGQGIKSFTTFLGDALGWDDIINTGVGGTGYLATNVGLGPTYCQRVQHDIIAENPDIVWWEGSRNDWGSAASSVAAAAHTCWASVKAALPNVLQIASPMASGGVNTLTTGAIQVYSAMQTQAAADGVVWVDPVHMPLQGTPLTGTLQAAASASADGMTTGIGVVIATNCSTNCGLQSGAILDIEPGTANEEQIEIHDWLVGGAGKYTVHFPGTLQHAHAINAPYTQVGHDLWTGGGNNVSPTGYGNSDLYVGSGGGDTIHPAYPYGPQAIGTALANLLQAQTTAP